MISAQDVAEHQADFLNELAVELAAPDRPAALCAREKWS
jgi:hypothetical protein